MKKIILYLKRFGLFCMASLLFYLFSAFLLSFLSTQPEPTTCPQTQGIYVTSNGVHLDVILSRQQLSALLQQNLHLSPETAYVAFGWGDKGFYLNTPTWQDLTFSTACNALFFPSETTLHLTYYRATHQDWKYIALCPEQLKQLNAYIQATFTQNAQGEFIKIKEPGYFYNDVFYEAEGHYSFINTCNCWVNNALKAAQVPTSIWSPFDWGVLYHADKKWKD
ncbi:TIGR02117 family protein [Rapidithrix thailandica]|uniref:TIGR02117 family protein n=1 Tax=Rapidithrix thailandica TaxID=413964 RepID=A0AAW9S220_9BACT